MLTYRNTSLTVTSTHMKHMFICGSPANVAEWAVVDVMCCIVIKQMADVTVVPEEIKIGNKCLTGKESGSINV
jgi:hypothetical protein